MKNKKNFSKKKIILFSIIAFLILFFLFNFGEKNISLDFSIKETGEMLEGNLFLNGIYLGTLSNGSLNIPKENLTANSELKFVTNYEGKDREFYFDIFSPDLEESRIDFVLTNDQLTDDYWYLEELHWTHMPITYKIDKYCGNYEIRQLTRAFQEIENKTKGVVYFAEVNNSPDIHIGCEFLEDCYEYHIDIEDVSEYFYWKTEWETICEHDLGYAQIVDYEGDKILKANITMVGLAGFAETDNRGMSGFKVGNCGDLNTELHEILHTFGYGHTETGIMAPYQEYTSGYRIHDSGECEGANLPIDSWIIEDLVRTYSKE